MVLRCQAHLSVFKRYIQYVENVRCIENVFIVKSMKILRNFMTCAWSNYEIMDALKPSSLLYFSFATRLFLSRRCSQETHFSRGNVPQYNAKFIFTLPLGNTWNCSSHVDWLRTIAMFLITIFNTVFHVHPSLCFKRNCFIFIFL
jgi:hypothetical protein